MWMQSSVQRRWMKSTDSTTPSPNKNNNGRRLLHTTLGFLIGSRRRIYTPIRTQSAYTTPRDNHHSDGEPIMNQPLSLLLFSLSTSFESESELELEMGMNRKKMETEKEEDTASLRKDEMTRHDIGDRREACSRSARR
jgi:hypothetical protein